MGETTFDVGVPGSVLRAFQVILLGSGAGLLTPFTDEKTEA